MIIVIDNDRIFSEEDVLEADVGMDSYKIVCNSYGDTKWFYQDYSNTDDRDDFEVLLISTNPVLTINSIKYMHSGFYFCYGVYPNTSSHFIAMRTLKVYGMFP